MQLGSMFISNCNNTLHVSDAICVHPQEHLKTVVTASGVDMRRGEVILTYILILVMKPEGR
jgi:hypothetical protein